MTDDAHPFTFSYDTSHQPNEAHPGLHIKPPVSHERWEHAENLEALILECVELFGSARHPRTDASWPRLRARLRQYRALILAMLAEGQLDQDTAEKSSFYLRYLEFYLDYPAYK